MPMPPRHPAAAGGRQRPLTAPSPVSPAPAGLTAMMSRQTFEGRWQLRQSIGSEVLHDSDREDDRPSRYGQPLPDGSLEARERKDPVSLLSPPSSQPSPRASLLGSRNGSATPLARISGAFRSCSRSWNTGTRLGSGSGERFRASVAHPGLASSSFLDICQVLPLPLAPCAWAIRPTWTGVRERWATRKAIRSACLSLAVRAACCRGALGCVHVRLRAIRDGHPFQFRCPLRRL